MVRNHRILAGRGMVWCLVICAHVALLMLLSNSRTSRQAAKVPVQEPLLLFWLEPRPREDEPEEEEPVREVTRAQRVAESRAEEPAGDAAISVPLEAPPIDWYAEAGHAARSKAADMMAKQDKSCEARKRPGSLLPKCRKDRPSFEWEPEEKRAGISGGLPYVRLGKRCVFALIFVGCALGKLPGPHSYAEEMRDPDRPRDSVPDLEEEDPAFQFNVEK